MLEKLTFTGIDENVDLDRVVRISACYPKVEFAILVGGYKKKPIFPPFSFIDNWIENVACYEIPSAIHLCLDMTELALRYDDDGSLTRELCIRDW